MQNVNEFLLNLLQIVVKIYMPTTRSKESLRNKRKTGGNVTINYDLQCVCVCVCVCFCSECSFYLHVTNLWPLWDDKVSKLTHIHCIPTQTPEED